MEIEQFKSDLSKLHPVEVVRKNIVFGHPHAIDENQYYELRRMISNKHKIHPAEVLLVGSAKLGFSIAPQKRYRPFCDESDLDLVLLAPTMFDKIWLRLCEFVKKGGYWPLKEKQDFSLYLLRGWIRPDKLPVHETFILKNEWFEFFRSLSQSGKFGPYKVNGGIYRTWSFLENYQTICVEQCIQELEINNENNRDEPETS